jgi:hypothetical protein
MDEVEEYNKSQIIKCIEDTYYAVYFEMKDEGKTEEESRTEAMIAANSLRQMYSQILDN